MDRDIPAFNQLIVNKINQKNRLLHEQRLINIRVPFYATAEFPKFSILYIIFDELASKPKGAAVGRRQEDWDWKAQSGSVQ